MKQHLRRFYMFSAAILTCGLSLAMAGCPAKTEDAAQSGNGKPTAKTAAALPANTPPQVAKSIQASQDMGNQMQQNANANGAAMAKATRP